jgi:hypothetical protein
MCFSVKTLISIKITSENFVEACAIILGANDVTENYCNCSGKVNAIAIVYSCRDTIIQHPERRKRFRILHFPTKSVCKRTLPLHLDGVLVSVALVAEHTVEEPDDAYVVWNYCHATGMKTEIAKNKSGDKIHCQ